MASKYPETEAFIRKYGDSVENEIESRLTGYNKIASGKLYDSIRYDVKETKKEFILTFSMAEYGKYVDKGVKPKKYLGMKRGKSAKKSAFIEALKKWCKIKGIPEGAAFPIRRNIWKYGIAPTNFFTIPTTRRQKYFERELEKAMAKDIDTQLQKEIDGNN
jgi:hypothetical protein